MFKISFVEKYHVSFFVKLQFNWWVTKQWRKHIPHDSRILCYFTVLLLKRVKWAVIKMLRYYLILLFSQDSSEAEDLRQSVCHFGGVSPHGRAGEGEDGAPAVLCVYYDQNHLHQLWVSSSSSSSSSSAGCLFQASWPQCRGLLCSFLSSGSGHKVWFVFGVHNE